MHVKANEHVYCNRWTKVNGIYRRIIVKQPTLVRAYNTLRKTYQFWKTLFFHFLDIARVNSFILFQDWRKNNDSIGELQCSDSYSQLEFSVELMKQLAGIKNDVQIPIYEQSVEVPEHPVNPKWSVKAGNCKRCWRLYRKESRTKVICGTCNKCLCFTPNRNCLNEEHQ